MIKKKELLTIIDILNLVRVQVEKTLLFFFIFMLLFLFFDLGSWISKKINGLKNYLFSNPTEQENLELKASLSEIKKSYDAFIRSETIAKKAEVVIEYCRKINFIRTFHPENKENATAIAASKLSKCKPFDQPIDHASAIKFTRSLIKDMSENPGSSPTEQIDKNINNNVDPFILSNVLSRTPLDFNQNITRFWAFIKEKSKETNIKNKFNAEHAKEHLGKTIEDAIKKANKNENMIIDLKNNLDINQKESLNITGNHYLVYDEDNLIFELLNKFSFDINVINDNVILCLLLPGVISFTFLIIKQIIFYLRNKKFKSTLVMKKKGLLTKRNALNLVKVQIENTNLFFFIFFLIFSLFDFGSWITNKINALKNYLFFSDLAEKNEKMKNSINQIKTAFEEYKSTKEMSKNDIKSIDYCRKIDFINGIPSENRNDIAKACFDKLSKGKDVDAPAHIDTAKNFLSHMEKTQDFSPQDYIITGCKEKVDPFLLSNELSKSNNIEAFWQAVKGYADKSKSKSLHTIAARDAKYTLQEKINNSVKIANKNVTLDLENDLGMGEKKHLNIIDADYLVYDEYDLNLYLFDRFNLDINLISNNFLLYLLFVGIISVIFLIIKQIVCYLINKKKYKEKRLNSYNKRK